MLLELYKNYLQDQRSERKAKTKTQSLLPKNCVSKIQTARDTSASTVLTRGCATVLT